MLRCRNILTMKEIRAPEAPAATKAPTEALKPRPRRPRHASGTRGETENKYRTLFEKIPVGLYWTSPGGEILDLNPAMAQMLGYAARDEALGKNARDFYLDPMVREHSTELLHKDNVLRNFEFQLRRADGNIIWVQDNVRIVFDDHGRVAYYEGSILDITPKKQEEERLEKRASQVIQHQAALLELAGLNLWDLEPVLPAVTEIAAGTLNVERVGVWLFNAACTEIACRDLYHRSLRRHGRGQTLRARDYPRYFGALKESCVISVDDVLADPRTGELVEDYLRPEGITSMLDIPVRRNGRVIGILCHEHTGPPRSWTLEEQHFAGSVGDIVALAVEASERQRMDQDQRRHPADLGVGQLRRTPWRGLRLDPPGHLRDHPGPAISISPSTIRPTDLLSFPYFVDEFDTAPAPKPARPGTHGVRAADAARPLLASPEVFARAREARRGRRPSAPRRSTGWACP